MIGSALPDANSGHSDYFTPPHYATLAHIYLQQCIATDDIGLYDRNWWDAACGTGQLTEPCPSGMRGKLFTSTLHADDAAKVAHPSLTMSFTYDFQRQVDCDLPAELRHALEEQKHWAMIINPPFKATTSARLDSSPEIGATIVAKDMGKVGLRRTANVSSMQFLYRILELATNYNLDLMIGVFTQPTFLIADSYAGFLDLWLDRFKFVNGFVVNGKEFGVKWSNWPLAYTVWKTAKSKSSEDRSFSLHVYVKGWRMGQKLFSPCAHTLSSWIDRPKATVVVAPLTSALKVRDKPKANLSKLPPQAIGFVVSSGNDVMHTRGSFLLSSAYANGNGWGVTPDNIEDSLTALAARCLVRPNWLNDRDQFSVPDTSKLGYQTWSKDAIMWILASVYNSSSSFLAHYQGEDYSISNEFFWMLPSEVGAISDMPDEIRNQAANARSPFFAQWIKDQTLSSEAESVLSYTKQIVYDTAALRPSADPSMHLHRWDAGWYQLRHGFLRQKQPLTGAEELTARYQPFKRMHRKFGERLADGVYDFGFLNR